MVNEVLRWKDCVCVRGHHDKMWGQSVKPDNDLGYVRYFTPEHVPELLVSTSDNVPLKTASCALAVNDNRERYRR